MLMPKKVKYRKQQRGRMRGKAYRGCTVAFGDFGLMALEPCWMTDRQIEAARVAMARGIKRGGKIWFCVPGQPIQEAQKPNGQGKAHRKSGLLSKRAASLRMEVYPRWTPRSNAPGAGQLRSDRFATRFA